MSDEERGKHVPAAAQFRLNRAFGPLPITKVTRELIAEYVNELEVEGRFADEINWGHLFWLQLCLKFAVERKDLQRVPEIPESTHWSPHKPSAIDQLMDRINRRPAVDHERLGTGSSSSVGTPPKPLGAAPKLEPTTRGKLSPKDLQAHIDRHPIGKRSPDGSLFSMRQRAAALKKEQGISIDRTTMSKRIKKALSPPTPAP